MAGEPEAAAAPQTEIVAKEQLNLRVMLPFILPMAFMLIVTFLISGIQGALALLLIDIVGVSIFLFGVRRGLLHRALFNREEVTLLSRGLGWLSGRPFHFCWDEVLEAREKSFRWMRIRLNRTRKFWTFHLQPKRKIWIPEGIWADPQFTEALRAHVPADRIHAEPVFDQRLSWSVRYKRVLLAAILICAATAVACGFLAFPDESFFRQQPFPDESFLRQQLRIFLGLAVIGLAVALYIDHAPAPFKVAAGFLAAFALLSPRTFLLSLLYPRDMRLITGYWGALAGALVGAALMVTAGKKYRGWRYAGAALLLAAAGFCCGWSSYREVTGVRMGVGWVGYYNPWTPRGDAFLMTEGHSDTETTLCWYSSDLKLERRTVLPVASAQAAIGQEAAIFRVFEKPVAELWFVPRRAEPRLIDEAPAYGHRGSMSPDSRHALFSVWGEQERPIAYKICDLDAGKVEPVNFPVPLKDISVFALRDDQTVLWLTGSFPLDKKNHRWAWANPVPENGEFPHPGKTFVVWSWKINSAEPPAQLYAARSQWLEWKHAADKPGQLRVRRVSEKPPARMECVKLDFTRSPLAEEAISEQEFNEGWIAPYSSYDGRFEIEAGSDSAGPSFVLDTKTGRKFHVPVFTELFLIKWSPSANEFLMEVLEMKLEGGRWSWHSGFEFSQVVYFVDMDRQ